MVKIALFLFFLGALFFVDGISCLIEHAARFGRPVEYFLEPGASGVVLAEKLQRLQETEGVVGVSWQKEYKIDHGGKSLNVTVLSKEYLSDCYGMEDLWFQNQFWLGRQAFSEFLGTGTESSAHITYSVDGKFHNGTFNRFEPFPETVAGAVAIGDPLPLRDAVVLRVMFQNAGFSETTVKRLETQGFSILNGQQILLQNRETEWLFLRLGYDTVTVILCITAGWAFYSLGKAKTEGLSWADEGV